MLLPLVLAPHHSFTRTASTKTLGSAQPRPPRMDREDHAQITAGAPASALWPAARWRRPRPWQAQATPSRRRLRWRRSLPAAPADGVGSWTSPSQGQAPSRATPPAAGAGGQPSPHRLRRQPTPSGRDRGRRMTPSARQRVLRHRLRLRLPREGECPSAEPPCRGTGAPLQRRHGPRQRASPPPRSPAEPEGLPQRAHRARWQSRMWRLCRCRWHSLLSQRSNSAAEATDGGTLRVPAPPRQHTPHPRQSWQRDRGPSQRRTGPGSAPPAPWLMGR